MQFSRLRLSGFKSFVDPAEVMIEPGVTGIVGPNGCGKSNLVEALRWVMGETSAKRMRGGEMDDVIFAGSANRPARNLAEVALVLDNADRKAPAQFNDSEELEVVRRIEREQGSLYRINGKEVRARDVQLLFADAATGAQSPSIVSQGRVGAVINAKPKDRRSLLEEAAGIAGLHSRRHEAELRLRAAETNLERVDDVVGTLETQLGQVKKQVRQATRYRNIADQLRRTEGLLFHLEAEAARVEEAAAEERLKAASAAVDSAKEAAAKHGTEQAEAAALLPDLRQAEAEAAAALQRLLLERQGLEQEEERLRQAGEAARGRLAQLDADAERAQNLKRDAEEAGRRLDEERAELRTAAEGEAEAAEEMETRLAEERRAVEGREERLGELNAKIAGDAERASALERRIEELGHRLDRLKGRLEESAEEAERLKAEGIDEMRLAEARETREAAEARLEEIGRALAEAESAAASARQAEETARNSLDEARREEEHLKAEAAALAKLVEPAEAQMWPALVDAVKVAAGLEAALGAALGDELDASADDGAPIHWRELPPLEGAPALPEGAEALAAHVTGPKALNRRLSQTGLVADEATGRRLQADLLPGQRLVTREGAVWRWDGYSLSASAPTAAAQRLQQKNRLSELRGELEKAEAEREKRASVHAEAKQRLAQAIAEESEQREAQRAAYGALSEAREAESTLAQEAERHRSRLAAIEENRDGLLREIEESEAALAEARAAHADLPDLAAERSRAAELRAELAEARSRLAETQSARDRQAAEAAARSRRLAAIEDEAASWGERAETAEKHLNELAERRQAAEAELERLVSEPESLTQRREALVETIEQAEAERRKAADALASGETRQAEADRAAKEAEARLSDAREGRARAEGGVEQARQALGSIAQRAREHLDAKLEDLLSLAETDPSQDLPERADLETKVERLIRERENIGPVNLRAEAEAKELQDQIDAMNSEREDLLAAIARLRQGISSLNREGRQRLLEAFEAVNQHFQELFVRLFGGGRAHLSLVESDDPLEAGLEIMARPPGKRLQVLSLLSGGEQALTALALLFAVFLTNPAPICVLDEVDAPLDDANVDRFCTLVEELARGTGTRFLVVTHHRMTMARVDRLFGVTMAERGISQLVSVDLQEAEALRETA